MSGATSTSLLRISLLIFLKACLPCGLLPRSDRSERTTPDTGRKRPATIHVMLARASVAILQRYTLKATSPCGVLLRRKNHLPGVGIPLVVVRFCSGKIISTFLRSTQTRMRIRAGKVLTDSYKRNRRYRFTIPSATCNTPQLASLAGERDVVPELYCSYVGRCTLVGSSAAHARVPRRILLYTCIQYIASWASAGGIFVLFHACANNSLVYVEMKYTAEVFGTRLLLHVYTSVHE